MRRRWSPRWVGLALGLSIAAVTVPLVLLGVQYLDRRAASRAELTVQQITGSVKAGMEDLVRDVYGVRALVAASETVTRSEFQAFAENFGFPSGARGLALVDVVPAEILADYEEEMRRTNPEYSVFQMRDGKRVPPEARPVHLPVRYFATAAGSDDVSGLDIASVGPQMYAAMAAVSSGQPRASAIHKLAVPGKDGFVIYLPTASTELGAQVAAVSVVLDDFLAARVRPHDQGALTVEVTTEGESTSAMGGMALGEESFNLAGQRWWVRVAAPGGSAVEPVRWLPVLLYGAAALVPALAGWIGWTTARGFETSRNLHYAVMLSTEKDKFLASVSHELRTPLAAVSGFIKELRQGWRWLGEEERDEYLQIVDEQTEEITSIVRDLLVATRLDSDEIALQPEAVPAPRLVGQALESMPLPPDRRIVVEVAEVEVWADALRTRQIVRNLVANAVRHGGPNIRVTAEASDSEVCLQVADDGEGIPHHIEAAVFDAYVEGAGRPLPSMGLGLFVSRRLAECMGGRLEYERNDGTTVFKLELPRPAPLPSTISA